MGQPLKETKAQTPPTGGQNPQQPREDRPEDSRPNGAGVDTGAGITRPKTAEEVEADRLYEERMEEEYAKREGGS